MSITVTFDFPAELEARLTETGQALADAVREAFALDLFRRGAITHAQLAQALRLDRFETDALLKRRDVPSPLTHEEVDEDVRTLQAALARAGRGA